MPHCIIEYAEDLVDSEEMQTTVNLVNTVIDNSGLFDTKTIKTRAIPISNYLVGGVKKPFIHLTIKMLAGRTDVQMRQLGEDILNNIRNRFNVEDISVEVTELNSNYYK